MREPNAGYIWSESFHHLSLSLAWRQLKKCFIALVPIPALRSFPILLKGSLSSSEFLLFIVGGWGVGWGLGQRD